MMALVARVSLIAVALGVAACGSSSSPAQPTPITTPTPAAGFTLTGDPASPNGATWTYQGLAPVLFPP